MLKLLLYKNTYAATSTPFPLNRSITLPILRVRTNPFAQAFPEAYALGTCKKEKSISFLSRITRMIPVKVINSSETRVRMSDRGSWKTYTGKKRWRWNSRRPVFSRTCAAFTRHDSPSKGWLGCRSASGELNSAGRM